MRLCIKEKRERNGKVGKNDNQINVDKKILVR